VAAHARVALALNPVPTGGSSAIDIAVNDTGSIPPQLSREAASRPLAGPSDRRLIKAAQNGSEAALETLYRRHWPIAHRAAYLVVRDRAAAEDIAQEAFLSAVRSLDRFDRRRPFGPWLHRIVVNRAIDWGRAKRLRGELSSDPETHPDAVERRTPPAPEPSSPISDDVGGALASLDPERRAIVVLRYLLEFTPGEIAEALEIPRGTVNSRLRRALDELGERLERSDP
jgi:RNA polymerase sigma-70 factor (ECF subfamily)